MKKFPYRALGVLFAMGTCGAYAEQLHTSPPPSLFGGPDESALVEFTRGDLQVKGAHEAANLVLTNARSIAGKRAAEFHLNADERNGFLRTAAGIETKRPSLLVTDFHATLDAESAGTLHLSVPTRPDLKLSFNDSRKVVGSLSEGVLTFENARPFVDRLVTTDHHRIEELLVLKSREAGDHFSWGLEADGLNAAADGRGGLLFYGDGRQPIFAVPQPLAIDANGNEQKASLTWDGVHKRMDVSFVPGPDTAYPVLLDPSIETMVWEQISHPTLATSPAMTYDESRGRLVMYAGGVTWTTRGDVWSKASDAGPPARFQTAMAYDRLRQKVVLFGGFDGSPNGETWEWDGTSWSKIIPLTNPEARSAHGMAYDPTRQHVVMFGGQGATNALQDMWEWTGAAWTEIKPTTRPSARSGASMVLDSNRGVVVLFGGTDPNAVAPVAFEDTWEWNGTNWSEKTVTPHPSGRSNATAAFDARNKRFTLIGGEDANGDTNAELWYWQGTAWSQATIDGASPSARFGAAAEYVPGKNIFLFGGSTGDDTAWRWDSAGGEWSTMDKYSTPGAISHNAFFYDTARKNVVSYGGSTKSNSINDLNATLTWNGTSWSQAAAGTMYVGGTGFAFDSSRTQAVLLGGYGANGTGGSTNLYLQTVGANSAVAMTVTWDGTTWTERTVTNGPYPRGDLGMVYDSKRQRVVAFGGYQPQVSGGCGVYAAKYYNDIWAWDGSTWTDITPVGALPAARQGMAMAYDAMRDRIVLFGGSGAGNTVYSDTWEFDGTNWAQLAPAHAPNVNATGAAVYDTLRHRVTLFAIGKGAVGGLLRTWTWDGTDWTNISSASAPPARNYIRVAFDQVHGEFVLHGGANVDPLATSLSDTWRFYSRGGDCTQDSDCPTGHCTDGVCCERDACGTCEACNVVGSSGTCSKLRNMTDPDSCTSGKACDAAGACKPVNGQACKVGSDCASGFCVDEVCCDTSCQGTCQACRADLKTSGNSGTCGPARAGVDPRNDCPDDGALSCQRDGTCDGAGRCRTYSKGTSCGTSVCVGNRAAGKVCDGIGACVNSSDGFECAPFICATSIGSCPSACTRDIDCTTSTRCDTDTGMCVTREGASCKDDHTVLNPDGKTDDCGTYKCSGGACLTTCSSINECVTPAICTSDNKCVLDGSDTSTDNGGGCSCSVPKQSSGGSHLLNHNTWLLVALAVAAKVRRSRRSRRV